MKKTVIIVLLAIVVILVGIIIFMNTGNESSNPNITAQELYEKISNKVQLPEMLERNSSDLEMRYGISTENVSSFKYMSNGTSYYVDTVAIFKSEDSATRETIKASLENTLTSTRNSMKNYDAEQYRIAEDGEVFTKNNFVFLVMSPAINEIKDIINDNI